MIKYIVKSKEILVSAVKFTDVGYRPVLKNHFGDGKDVAK